MGRRNCGGHKKVTTVTNYGGGNKRIETRWVPEGSGCGGFVMVAIILFFFSSLSSLCSFFFRGCG